MAFLRTEDGGDRASVRIGHSEELDESAGERFLQSEVDVIESRPATIDAAAGRVHIGRGPDVSSALARLVVHLVRVLEYIRRRQLRRVPSQ